MKKIFEILEIWKSLSQTKKEKKGGILILIILNLNFFLYRIVASSSALLPCSNLIRCVLDTAAFLVNLLRLLAVKSRGKTS